MIITAGKTAVTVDVYFVDDDGGTAPGEPTTGKLFSNIETGGSASYHRQGAARVDFTLVTQTVAAAHTDGGFVLIDDTNMPGLYRLDVPDAAFATGVDYVIIQLVMASANNSIMRPLLIDLTDVDLRDSVRGGMTALPNAVVDGAGGLVTSAGGATGIDDLATPTNITAGTITTVTNLTNAATSGDLTATMKTSVNTEADTALSDIDLDHLIFTAAAIPAVTAGTFLDQMFDDGTAVYDRTTDSLQAIRDHATTIKSETALIVADTNELQGDDVPGLIAALNDITAANVWAVDATSEQTQGTFGQAIGDPVADTTTIYQAVATDATGDNVAVDVVAVKAETVLIVEDTGTTIPGTITTLQADTDDIQTRLPAALVNSRMDSTIDAAGFEQGAIDNVWDEPLTGSSHNVATSSGRRLRQVEEAFVHANGTIAAVTDGHTFTLDAGAVATADYYISDRLQIVEGVGAGQSRIITGYTLGKVVTLDSDFITNPNTASLYEIVAADVHVAVSDADLATGFVAVATSTTTITLDAGAEATEDYYNDMQIVFTHGTGMGQSREIQDYTSGRVVTMSPALITALDTTTTWHIQSSVSASHIVNEVWDEDATGHQTAGTFGQAIGDPGANTETIYDAVVTDATGTNVASDVVAVKAETALIVADTGTDGVVVAAASKSDYRLSATGVDDVLDEVYEGTTTFRQFLRVAASALFGKLSGAATSTISIRDEADSKDRIVATVDSDGNRSAITLDKTA